MEPALDRIRAVQPLRRGHHAGGGWVRTPDRQRRASPAEPAGTRPRPAPGAGIPLDGGPGAGRPGRLRGADRFGLHPGLHPRLLELPADPGGRDPAGVPGSGHQPGSQHRRAPPARGRAERAPAAALGRGRPLHCDRDRAPGGAGLGARWVAAGAPRAPRGLGGCDGSHLGQPDATRGGAPATRAYRPPPPLQQGSAGHRATPAGRDRRLGPGLGPGLAGPGPARPAGRRRAPG